MGAVLVDLAVRNPTLWCNFWSNKVRNAQLRAGCSTGLAGVWVTDAFGLPMLTDGVHLLTNAQVRSHAHAEGGPMKEATFGLYSF